MKRSILVFFGILLVSSIIYAIQDEEKFSAFVHTDQGQVSMGFHTGFDKKNGWGVSVGYQEYGHTSVPADFSGEIFIPDSVREPSGQMVPVYWISRGSFQSCPNMSAIHLPASLLAISDLAFEQCISLREITFPANLKIIYPRAFAGCKGLQRIQFLGINPPRAYFEDTFDEASYAHATLVVPALSTKEYLSRPVASRFRYHAEVLPLYNEVHP